MKKTKNIKIFLENYPGIAEKLINVNNLEKGLYKKLAKKYNAFPISQYEGIRECNECGDVYFTKYADLKRGWGLRCSKTCVGYSNAGNDYPHSRSLGNNGITY